MRVLKNLIQADKTLARILADSVQGSRVLEGAEFRDP